MLLRYGSKAARRAFFLVTIACFLYRPNMSMAATALTSLFSCLPIGPDPAVTFEKPDFAGYNVPIPLLLNASGRVTALAVDTNQPGRLFLGAANGGLWESTDGGRHLR